MDPKLQEILENSRKIFICSHLSPDADAVCSLLATYDFLSKAYPDKEYGLYFSTEDKYEIFDSLKNFEKIQWVNDIADYVNQYDTLIFLDHNVVARFSKFPEKIDLTKFKSICIDHHPNVPEKFDYSFIDSTKGSCTQLVYQQLFKNSPQFLDREVAEIILLGIMGDTGTFRYIDYRSTESLDVTKEILLSQKLSLSDISLKIDQITEREFEIVSELFKNFKLMTLERNKPFVYSYVPFSILNKYKLSEIKTAADSFKFSFLRKVKGYNWGFVVHPDSEKSLTVSFRSALGGPNVSKIAQVFGGGGHVMAAAGHMPVSNLLQDSPDLCALVIEYIRSNELELITTL